MKILSLNVKSSQLSKINPKVKLRRMGKKEKGLFAVKDIRKGEIITISGGIIIPLNIVKKLPKDLIHFAYHVENGFFQVPFTKQNITPDWYMNHSCKPNANGLTNIECAITIKAMRHIKAGEEILYDYGEDQGNSKYRPFRKFNCRCGSENCRKIIRY